MSPEPTRTCVACRGQAGKPALVRVARQPDGSVAVDTSGRAPGRGAYLHRDAACVEAARRRRSLERALRTAVPAETWTELAHLLEQEEPH